MPARYEMPGGTLGAHDPDFLRLVMVQLDEIAARHKLDWYALSSEIMNSVSPAKMLIRPDTFRHVAIDGLMVHIEDAVTLYQKAPPLAPSRRKRDFYDPAVKAASTLAAHLQNEYSQNLLASAFESHDEALDFLNRLQKIALLNDVDEDIARYRTVEKICAEFNIRIVEDEVTYIKREFGIEAAKEYQEAEISMMTIARKHRTDPIRFRLAHDVLETVMVPFGLMSIFARGEDIPRQALAEIVTLFVEVVGTRPGTPKPSEGYFARVITNEALELLAAELAFSDVGEKYGN